MFLNYGAGLHGHEFSDPSNNHSKFTLRKYPLTRSSLVTNTSRSRKNIINEPSLVNEVQPITPVPKELSRIVETTVRFQEPARTLDIDTPSEGEESVVNSENGKCQSKTKVSRRKRAPRKSSIFHLAHPAPTLTHTQKLLQIRPKLLLQLQLISEQTRPKPSIDVLPSPVLIPRLARKFPRLLRGKGELGTNDVIVVKSEDYDSDTDYNMEKNDMGEDFLENRVLIAVICQMPRVKGTSLGVAEIVFSDGSICIATPLPGGLYEMRVKDQNKSEIIAHWWIKKYPMRESLKTMEFAEVNTDLKYAFSVIDPNRKRHPIMATITHKRLEILDTYTTLSSSSGKHPPTKNIRDGLQYHSDEGEMTIPERATCVINQRMQTLIQVTGIWVSLRQNWCPYFKYNDALAVACSSTYSQPVGLIRSFSLTRESRRPQSAINSQNTSHTLQNNMKTTNFGSTIRRVSVKKRSIPKHSSQFETPVKPERTMSIGTEFVQRTAARRASTCASSPISRADEYECVKTLSQQIPSDKHSTSTLIQSLTPPYGFPLSRSPTNATDQTSRVHTRTQSAYYPPSPYLDELHNMHQSRRNSDTTRVSDNQLDTRPRNSRWKLVSNFFRRINMINSRSEFSR